MKLFELGLQHRYRRQSWPVCSRCFLRLQKSYPHNRKLIYKTLTFATHFYSGNADVAKLADALDLGSSAARHVGSTPIIRTNS